MVTINPDKPIQPIITPKTADGASTSSETSFDAVFRQAVETKPSPPAGIEATPFIADVHPARFNNDHPSAKRMVVDRVQNLIETMAGYQEKLGKHGATLKDLHGIVGQMASQSEALGTAAKSVAGDEKLENIVNEALKLSSLEIVRYYNGHYGD